jgi:hypothetical protein
VARRMKEERLLIGVPASEACTPAEARVKIDHQIEELRGVLRFVDSLVAQGIAHNSTSEVRKIREIVEDKIAGLDAFGQFIEGKSQ